MNWAILNSFFTGLALLVMSGFDVVPFWAGIIGGIILIMSVVVAIGLSGKPSKTQV